MWNGMEHGMRHGMEQSSTDCTNTDQQQFANKLRGKLFMSILFFSPVVPCMIQIYIKENPN